MSLYKVLSVIILISALNNCSENNMKTAFINGKIYTVNEKRLVNIDPGYICPAKLVLATTKNYSHRIYLNKNIYGDIHLQFSNGTFQSQPWTYPDYQNKENIRFFNALRKRYLEQLGDVIY